MITILGLDPSLTSTGLVVLSGSGELVHREAVETEVIHSEQHKGFLTRIRAISGRILGVCGKYGPSVIVMEGLAFGAKGRTLLDLAGLHWHLRERLDREYPPVGGQMWIVDPKTLKNSVGCKGNADKETVAAAVRERYGIELPTYDEADAYALARIGLTGLRENFGRVGCTT